MSDNNYEFQLPNGAIVDTGLAKGPNGQPVNSAPVPLAQKDRYAFAFPLRPGETQFQVSYHLPYSGAARIEPKLLSAMEHFVVMLPKEMQFKPEAGSFQSIPDETGANVQVVTGVQPSQHLAFTVGGNGTLHLGDEQAQGGGGESGAKTHGEHAVGDEVHGRLVSGKQQQDEVRDDLVAREPVALFFSGDERAQ